VESDYLRRQAERCLHWAADCFDLTAAQRMRLLAEDFLKEADRIELSIRTPNARSGRDGRRPVCPEPSGTLKP
jgi:hypothetical protein